MNEKMKDIIKDILSKKYKVSKTNITSMLNQYKIDDSLSPEEWAEMMYFYETL